MISGHQDRQKAQFVSNSFHSPDLEIACYRFVLRVTRHISLPSFSGSTFHGGFGHGLHRLSRRFRDYFFRPPISENGRLGQALPKPFALIPPFSDRTEYAPGEEMYCGLLLFGKATRHFMIAFAAIEALGQELGIGRNKGCYRIASVEQLTLDSPITLMADDAWHADPNPVGAQDILEAHYYQALQVRIELTTRLRLKHNNLLVKEPPTFTIFMDRLIGRINSLSKFYGSGLLVPPALKRQLLNAADQIRLDPFKTTAHWSEWLRPPQHGREKMSFGGLIGTIAYTGDLGPFIPWLTLGQWTAVGGKTSFGLGWYHLIINGDSIGERYA